LNPYLVTLASNSDSAFAAWIAAEGIEKISKYVTTSGSNSSK
jgi:hypothetical protein